MKLVGILIILGLLSSLGYSIYSLGKSNCKVEVAQEQTKNAEEVIVKRNETLKDVRQIRNKVSSDSDYRESIRGLFGS